MWKETKTNTPPTEVLLNTKIDVGFGERDVQQLIFMSNLWWTSDKLSYVYYTPTHWDYLK